MPTDILEIINPRSGNQKISYETMTHPIISIIIPVYNAKAYLKTCLTSAINQTLKEIEIICVDDCSTDTSADILSDLAENDNRIRVIRHDINKGEGAARNAGLDNATGEYVFHLDADDTVPQDALALLYAEAKKHNSELVKGRYDIIHKDGRVEPQNWSSPDSKIINTNIHESTFLQRIPTSHCTYLYSRKFLDHHNIRYRADLIVGLDLIAITTALINAGAVTLIPDIVYHYHQSDTSINRGELSVEITLDGIRMKKIIADMLNAHGLQSAASSVLQSWEYIINTHWLRMPFSLTPKECYQTFSNFRSLITANNIAPWKTDTPHNHRYLLALVLNNRDEEALSFLRAEESSSGFSSQDRLIKALEFVLTQVPIDTGALTELAFISRKNGNLESALNFFEKIISYDKNNQGAQLQAAITLKAQGDYEKAYEKSDVALDILIRHLESYQQIIRATTLKEEIILEESTKKFNMIRKELNLAQKKLTMAQAELNTVYNSISWRVTKPLRKIIDSIKS